MTQLSIPEVVARDVKRAIMRVALEASGWSIAAAARALRMSRQALHCSLVPLGLREEYNARQRLLTRRAAPCTTENKKMARRRSSAPGRDRGGSR